MVKVVTTTCGCDGQRACSSVVVCDSDVSSCDGVDDFCYAVGGDGAGDVVDGDGAGDVVDAGDDARGDGCDNGDGGGR